ncbi:MAG: methyl-accepting chemotaxis protein [Methanoregula sp.]|nr:MAG: methyl-accepting chemotaxis protein [Methanoregula sp.]
MKAFRDFPVKAKLFVSFGIMILLLVIVAATAYLSVAYIQENNKKIHDSDLANVIDVLEVRGYTSENRDEVLSMIVEKNKSAIEQKRQDIIQRKALVDGKMKDLLSRNANDPVLLPKLQSFNELRIEYADTRDNEQIPLILSGKREEATQLALGIQQQRYSQIEPMVDDIVTITEQRVSDSLRQTDQLAAQMNTIILIAVLAALLLGLGLSYLLTQSISSPISTLAENADRIAKGDLTVQTTTESRADEIGMLNASFATMVKNLRDVQTDLSAGIGVLASSSSEILATTTQIAAGAAETASAVSETTATVEEVKQTVDLASQKAKSVAESSQQASAIAQSGQKAVDEVVGSMHRVQEQMESIADNVVQLAEKSQAIGEIIVTVNDIAEQSNILAVNASIEAAKTGEQGKGFGVVAQEIRTLAEQSKEATAQVRTILTDIQRGVSSAVMATEQGNRTVAESMKQSTEAGESIRVLAGTVGESSKAATQISASSQQQLVGMNQIVQSMENIKQASQQNLKGTQQAETAAKNLHDLGQKLKEIAGRYRI